MLNQFEEEKQETAQQQVQAPIRAGSEAEDAATNEMDFSFQRPKKQKKVCIVEEDIKMTKDEIEIYNQLRSEEELERVEQDRQHNQLFQQQQTQQPDLGPQNKQPARQRSPAWERPVKSAKKATDKR